MKYILAFVIITILAACSGEDKSELESTGSVAKPENTDGDLTQKVSSKKEDVDSQRKTQSYDQNSSRIDQNVSLVKQCSKNRCESYHLSINSQAKLSVSYANKKKKATSFVLTKRNIEVFNQALSAVKSLDKSQLIMCLNSNESAETYSLTLGDAPTSTSYLFAIGCQNEVNEVSQLARWFDNKAYYAIEN